MKNWIKKNKVIVILFFLALIPRLIYMLIAFFKLGDINFIKDQDGYIQAGLNFLTQGIFSADGVIPHSYPAPGYPILMAVSWLIIPKYLFIVLWQNIIYSFFIVFVYKFARLFFNNFISIGTAVFMAFEPFSFYSSNVTSSEAPFMFFFILSVYLLALFWKKEKWKFIIWSAVFLALAAFVRQIALFFYPILAIATIIILWKKVSWPKLVKYLIVYLIIFLAVLSPWMMRNKVQFGTYTISNINHFLYFFGGVRDYLVLSQGMTREQADAYLQNLAVEKAGVESFEQIRYVDEYIPVLREINFSVVTAQPLTYLKWHIIKAIPVFTESGWLRILSFWNIDLGQSVSVNISNLLTQKDFSALASSLKGNQIFLIRIFGIGFWLLINLIALIGAILMLKKRDLRRIGLVLLIIIGLIAFGSSWAAMARLRLPFQPFLFILFFYGVYRYLRYFNLDEQSR